MRFIATAIAIWGSLVPTPAFAQAGALAGRPTLTAVRAAQAPTIDGRLDDAIWPGAALIDTFVQEEPRKGSRPPRRRKIRVAYDSDRLYFGIYAHYSESACMRANRSDRDKLDNDDAVTIYLEPFLDYLRGYSFSVNGYGVQRDSMIVVTQRAGATPTATRRGTRCSRPAGQLVDDGWTAEMAIPIKSLRYPSREAGEAHRWGFQVRREITSKDERRSGRRSRATDANFLRRSASSTGMTNLSTQRNFELLPTFTAIGSGRLNATTGVFATDHVEEGGVGLKYGISSNLTFDFTYNPDFSQIESANPEG